MKIKSLILNGILLVSAGLGLQGCFDNEDPNARHNEEVKIIDQYIQNNNIADVLYDNAYGIRFRVLDYGDFAPPHESDKISGYYSARLLYDDGTLSPEFDFGTISDKTLADIEPGAMRYLASVMLEGSTGEVYAPSRYGFGTTGNASLQVPANVIVVYRLTLTNVDRGSAWEDRLETDTSALNAYIKNTPITGATQLPSGVWFTIDNPGTGAYARPYSIVNFEYELRLLNGNTPSEKIEFGTIPNQSAWLLIDGLKLMFPYLQEGTEATIYVPSGLGYGDTESPKIPKNSKLIFKIKLTDITTQ